MFQVFSSRGSLLNWLDCWRKGRFFTNFLAQQLKRHKSLNFHMKNGKNNFVSANYEPKSRFYKEKVKYLCKKKRSSSLQYFIKKLLQPLEDVIKTWPLSEKQTFGISILRRHTCFGYLSKLSRTFFFTFIIIMLCSSQKVGTWKGIIIYIFFFIIEIL